MSEFHFLRPLWLAALPLVLILPWLIARRAAGRSAWERSCDPALLRELMVSVGAATQRLPLVLLSLALILACLALAGPTWQQQPEPVYGRLHSRVVLFDLSASMGSGDLPPSRLERARFKLNDLVAGGGDREQALVVFAGDAFVVAPLTDDVSTLVNLIPALDTRTVPVQGSRVDQALKLALELLERGRARSAEVVLITDGIDPGYRDDTLATAAELSNRGHSLQVLGVGTEAGAPVSLPGGGFLTDGEGNIVVPGLDRNALAELAATGGGQFEVLRDGNADIARLNRPRQDIGRGIRDAERAGDHNLWVDSGALLLIPILLLASLAFRRGWLLVVPLALLPLPRPAMAFDWADLWSRPDQRAAAAMAEGNPQAVPESASSRWQAAAAYRRGEYDQAARLGGDTRTAIDHYNLGNARARMGDLDAAAESYRSALEMDPDLEDARFNLGLVEQAREQQAAQQQSSENSQDGESGDSQQGNEGDPQGGQDGTSDAPTDPGAQSGSEGQSSSAQDGPGDTEQAESNASTDPDGEEREGGRQDGTEMAEANESPDGKAEEEGLAASADADQGDGLEDLTQREREQAMAQWLRQVPDDPGGLLRRKFHYQYSRREGPRAEGQPW